MGIMNTESIAQQAIDQNVEAWREAWWDKVPHTQLEWNRGHIVRDGCLNWFWRY